MKSKEIKSKCIICGNVYVGARKRKCCSRECYNKDYNIKRASSEKEIKKRKESLDWIKRHCESLGIEMGEYI